MEKKDEKEAERAISDIVGAIFDPIIVFPGGWGDTLPDWMKQKVTLERLMENMKALKGEKPTGTDLEAYERNVPCLTHRQDPLLAEHRAVETDGSNGRDLP